MLYNTSNLCFALLGLACVCADVLVEFESFSSPMNGRIFSIPIHLTTLLYCFFVTTASRRSSLYQVYPHLSLSLPLFYCFSRNAAPSSPLFSLHQFSLFDLTSEMSPIIAVIFSHVQCSETSILILHDHGVRIYSLPPSISIFWAFVVFIRIV